MRSVALGLWVRTGSRDETPAQAGVSHFLEHLLFKGTKRYSAIEIAEIFDGLGAVGERGHRQGVDATSTRASSTPTPRRPSTCSRRCCSARPTRRSTPSARSCSRRSRCTRTSRRTRSTTCSTGRSSAAIRSAGGCWARREVISSIPIPDIDAYHRARYTGGEHRGRRRRERRARRDRRAHQAPRRAAGRRRRRCGARRPRSSTGRQVAFQQKDTEQFHICFGGPGHRPQRRASLRAQHPRRGLRWLDLIAALPRGPREEGPRLRRRLLHPAVRRQRPDRPLRRHPRRTTSRRPARSSAASSPRSTPRASPTTSSRRAKEHVKGRMVLSSESTAARMGRIGKAVLFDTPLLTLDELLEKVDAVTAEDVAELARELYAPGVALGRRDRPQRGALPLRARAGQRGARRGLGCEYRRGPASSAPTFDWSVAIRRIAAPIRSPHGRSDQGRRLRRRGPHGGDRLRRGRGR